MSLSLLPDSGKSSIKTTKSRLAIGQTTFSFGLVPRKTTLQHAFKYVVSMVDTVRIIRTVSSCGCTYAKIPKGPLAPKDTGSIVVTYTTGIVEGLFRKTFTLYTNSETTPEIVLTIEGTVMRCITTDPTDGFYLGQFDDECIDPITQEVYTASIFFSTSLEIVGDDSRSVPEPGSLGLIITGLMTFGFWLRRKKKV